MERLTVGGDGRNRTMLSPFGASSGRNTPSATRFIFGPAVWARSLIQPPEGRALAYVDWSSQEVAIAAALSGDRALLDAVRSGDPYLAFAIRAGLAPRDATKETHPAIRDACKACVLGANYGMGPKTLAYRIGQSELEARSLLRRMERTFPVFTDWSNGVVDAGQLGGWLSTVYGWRIQVTDTTRATTLRNFPMQANGAEMLRVACCLATEQGVTVCAPVHDALLIEAGADELDDTIQLTRSVMSDAARAVLAGEDLRTDASVVRWPDRYSDPRGVVMWERVTHLLDIP
jgi:DNA polymerase I-like protein with 3'-5' exonuclease and polymerase domains